MVWSNLEFCSVSFAQPHSSVHSNSFCFCHSE